MIRFKYDARDGTDLTLNQKKVRPTLQNHVASSNLQA